MHEQLNSPVARAILHALPTAVIALDSLDNILVANNSASKLLGIPRENLEGGPLARFTTQASEISSSTHAITFSTGVADLTLAVAAKDVVVDNDSIRVLLLRGSTTRQDNTLVKLINDFSTSSKDPYVYICQAMVDLSITKYACVKSNGDVSAVLASTTESIEIFETSPTIERQISQDDTTNISLVLIPDGVHGLTRDDLSIVDMFIALIHMRRNSQETALDASGSETALALALKAGDMGMCFFDTSRGDCYLSDRLATWCGINTDTFSGTLTEWINTFREDDRLRISTLFAQLPEHKKFKTVVNIHTLESDARLELHGRPLHENSTHEWVAIVKPFRDEQEVEAAWHTRIAMEESSRIEAETNLEVFESTLVETLLPTSSDVSIVHSRQDAGTWHIARPFGLHSHIYAVGAVTGPSRSHAIIGATMTATIADVLSSQVQDIDTFISLVRDHARARDIETSIAAVRVEGNKITSSSLGGASVYISGRSFSGEMNVEATTAMNVSSHSEASVENIDVAANGRPWRILSTVIEHVSVIDLADEKVKEDQTSESHSYEYDEANEDDESYDSEYNALNTVDKKSQNPTTENNQSKPTNVLPMRSGSITPN